MRRIWKTSVLKRIIFLVFVLLAAGCSLEKKSALNRGLQNLTAHYNILFNANDILDQKQQSYAVSFVDSYNEILNVYQDTTSRSNTSDKDLAEAKIKAGKIINVKEQSHYLGDAYLVLGKASYLDGDYFNAVEYFSYVIRSFPDKPKLVSQALTWKARSLIYLNHLPQAKLVIDSAIAGINPKKKSFISDVYATKMQYDIAVQDYTDAEAMGRLAVKYTRQKALRLRWTFILGQLQELNGKNPDAVRSYTSIIKSNASFEMAFNAGLNRIRIQDVENRVKVSRIDRLKALIRSENNKDFIDQVYYQIAQIYSVNNDFDNAIKNYKLSVRYSRKNPNQKGLSYLRIADINFKKADYVSAKKYYDSTLFSLSPNYPGYQGIQKKSDNLQLLADRFATISREDTLQLLAKLDEKTRSLRIDAMVNRQILQQSSAQVAIQEPVGAGGQFSGKSSFYFDNSNAVSQGYNDFKRIWGNRKLADNWRRSTQTTVSNNPAIGSAQSLDPDADATATDQPGTPKSAVSTGNFRQQLIRDLPLTPALLAQSNSRVFNAYFDIANFYRDILGDKKEAATIYELLLTRFPDNPDRAAIYYNLYRIYGENNAAKSDEYKNLILKNYGQTPYAKTIIDPEYGKKLSDADAGLNTDYDQVYDNFSKKKYKKAVGGIDTLLQTYPNNKLASQLAYLRAIASGHFEKLDSFRNELTHIVTKYPDDKLVTPLVKQHLAYIDLHKDEMASTPFALMNNDTTETAFSVIAPNLADQVTAYNNAQIVGQKAQQRIDPITRKPEILPADKRREDSLAAAQANKPVVKEAPSIFSLGDSTNYYFVINVASGTTNLASSRFGIGQFNRANFETGAITHQLMDAGNDNQLIYVGRFSSAESVKAYARAIIPLMPEIMKVPKEKYSFFIITKQNLDKIVAPPAGKSSKNILDTYIDYYQKNY